MPNLVSYDIWYYDCWKIFLACLETVTLLIVISVLSLSALGFQCNHEIAQVFLL